MFHLIPETTCKESDEARYGTIVQEEHDFNSFYVRLQNCTAAEVETHRHICSATKIKQITVLDSIAPYKTVSWRILEELLKGC